MNDFSALTLKLLEDAYDGIDSDTWEEEHEVVLSSIPYLIAEIRRLQGEVRKTPVEIEGRVNALEDKVEWVIARAVWRKDE